MFVARYIPAPKVNVLVTDLFFALLKTIGFIVYWTLLIALQILALRVYDEVTG